MGDNTAPGSAGLAIGDYAAAIRECDQALRNNPHGADAYCNRARARRALGDLDGAVADVTRALQLDPRHAWAHRTLGDIHLAQGWIKAALACCDEAIRLDPLLAEAYNTRAGARLLVGCLQDALADCDRAIRLAPHLWGFYITRGNVRYHLYDPNAADDYQRSFELNPAGYVRGIVQIIAKQVRGESDTLFASCAEHLRANSDDTTSYTRRGTALLLLGKDDEAQRDFDQSVLLKPASKYRVTMIVSEARRVRAAGKN